MLILSSSKTELSLVYAIKVRRLIAHTVVAAVQVNGRNYRTGSAKAADVGLSRISARRCAQPPPSRNNNLLSHPFYRRRDLNISAAGSFHEMVTY
jgi:hypothetical protein